LPASMGLWNRAAGTSSPNRHPVRVPASGSCFPLSSAP